AAVACRRDAEHRYNGRNGAARHRALEIVVVIFREGLSFTYECLEALNGPRLVSGKPFAHIGEKYRLGHFAVGGHVDPPINHPAHDLPYRTAHTRHGGYLIVAAAAQASLHHIEQIGWPWQAAHVCYKNPFFA